MCKKTRRSAKAPVGRGWKDLGVFEADARRLTENIARKLAFDMNVKDRILPFMTLFDTAA